MTKYYEVTAIREYERNGETKKQYTRLGTAFPFKEGNGFSVVLDAVPAPQDGQFRFMLFEPKPREGQGTQQSSQGSQQSYGEASGGNPSNDIDDEIPF